MTVGVVFAASANSPGYPHLMSLRISFDLEEDDLKHFRLIMREARKAAANLSAEDIIASARGVLKEVGNAKVPTFIRDRLANLETMIAMVEDGEWRLPEAEAARVLNALAYFGEPEDLIPDHIPGVGFLDDAIMVELVTRELRHEIQAYEDFVSFRNRESARRKIDKEDVSRENWLRTRRQELQSRMRRRRRTEKRRGTRKSPFSLL